MLSMLVFISRKTKVSVAQAFPLKQLFSSKRDVGYKSCAPKIEAEQRKRWKGPRDRTKRDKDVRSTRSQDLEGK